MIAKVIDTNVLIVANKGAEQASIDCTTRCIEALEEARQQVVVIDDAFLIFGEYQSEVSPTGQPGPGDAFLLWLLRNWANPKRCETVTLTPNDLGSFVEYPDDPDLANFDLSDHKFVAAANVSVNTVEVLYSVDSDWWKHREAFHRNGISIRLLCPDQVSKWKTKYGN